MATYSIKNANVALTCSAGDFACPIVNKFLACDTRVEKSENIVVKSFTGIEKGLTIELAGTPVATDSSSCKTLSVKGYRINLRKAEKFTVTIKCMYAGAKKVLKNLCREVKRVISRVLSSCAVPKLQMAGGLRL